MGTEKNPKKTIRHLRRNILQQNVSASYSPQAGHTDYFTFPFHRLSKLRVTVGATDYRDAMVAEAACIFRCESFEGALNVAGAWGRRWRRVNPRAVEQFLYGLRDSLRFYELPKRWWKRIRTNNPLERLIRTLRDRLRPMGCFHNEKAIEKAVFGQPLRWQKIKLTHNT